MSEAPGRHSGGLWLDLGLGADFFITPHVISWSMHRIVPIIGLAIGDSRSLGKLGSVDSMLNNL